jgi:putative ABC transport system permease protein
LPSDFSFLDLEINLVVPMSFEPGDNQNSRNNYFLRMIGRLREGVSQEQASTDFSRILDAIVAKHSVNRGMSIGIEPLHESLVGNVRRAVLVLFGAVGCVLLVACANLTNLLLARAVVRQREISVRLAVGASRTRLLRQFLIESLMLSCLGAGLGLLAAWVVVDALNLLNPEVLPRADAIRINPVVVWFTVGVAGLTGLLMGLAPALHSLSPDLARALRDAARGVSESPGRRRVRGALVVVEVALSLVLLAGAGLMVKSMYQLLNVETGFRSSGVLTLQVNLPASRYVDRELERRFDPSAYTRATTFFNELIDRTQSLPGVRSVGAINGLPLMGEVWRKNATLLDRPLPRDLSGLPPIQYRVVSGDYFGALGIRLLYGRTFTQRDTLDAPKVAVVNREMMRRHYGDVAPTGKLLSVNPPLELLPASLVADARRNGTLPPDYEPAKFTIVGVVDDVRYGGLRQGVLPLVYVPHAQGAEGTTAMYFVVRADGDPLRVADPFRQHVRDLDRDQPVANIRTMDARLWETVAQSRLQMVVLGAFAAIAALLAAIGIYGVMSYSVTQRSREIGIRLALGAARQEVLAMVLRQAYAMVGTGLAIGLAAALLLTGVLRSLLFGVSPTDPGVFAAIVALLAATGCLASYLPARRAARFDPVETLRAE